MSASTRRIAVVPQVSLPCTAPVTISRGPGATAVKWMDSKARMSVHAGEVLSHMLAVEHVEMPPFHLDAVEAAGRHRPAQQLAMAQVGGIERAAGQVRRFQPRVRQLVHLVEAAAHV